MSGSLQGRTRRPRLFYGWYVIGITGLSGAFAGGTSQAFFGLFVRPIEDDTGWSRTAIAGAITLATFVGGALSVLAGRLADRMGPRVLMSSGALIYGVAFLSMMLVTQVWHLYAAYFAARLAALHLLSGVVPRTAAVNWFRRMRGRALGLQNMAMPLGGALLSAVAGALLAAGLDWREIFALIGVAALVLLLVPVALVMRREPEEMGLLPDGDASPSVASPEAGARGTARSRARHAVGPERSWTLRRALRTRALWLVGIGTMLHALASGGISFHLPAYYADLGLGTGVAAAAAAIFLFSGAFSSTVWGYLTEHFDERHLVVVGTSAAVVLTFNGRFISEPVGALAFAAAYGATTRGEGALVMMMLAAYYGRRSFGAISGFVGTFSFVGLALGPIIYSRVFDVTGSYDNVFVASTVILAVAALLMWLARRPSPPAAVLATPEGLTATEGET